VKLMASLGFAVQNLKQPAAIALAACHVAVNHRSYGVTSHDYDTVGAALLDTLRAAPGEAFTPDYKRASACAYAASAAQMQEAEACALAAGPDQRQAATRSSPRNRQEPTTRISRVTPIRVAHVLACPSVLGAFGSALSSRDQGKGSGAARWG
jgi:hypothetical protein